MKVRPESELIRLLDEAAQLPLILEKEGVRFRLQREQEEDDDIWAAYDPEQVREVIRKTAGSWQDIDPDALIDQLHQAREEGSRPTGRP